jgi:5-formyltetrahydrofolate cyclo-ligase
MTADHARETKADLRALVRVRLRDLTGHARARLSQAACDQALAWAPLTRAGCVLAYAPMPSEVNVEPLIESLLARGVCVCIPRVDWDAGTIVPVRVTDLLADLTVVEHGVRQPRETLPAVGMEQIQAIVVPAVAFDLTGGRLGRGGGFYDRVLGGRARPGLVLGVGFEAQIVDEIPMEGHDQRVDALATPARLIEFGAARAATEE